MTNEEFESVINARIEKIREVLITKGREYAPAGTDRMHNFKVAVKKSRRMRTPVDAAAAFQLKHLISIDDMIEDFAAGMQMSKAYRDEKFGDAINYFIIMEALMDEFYGDIPYKVEDDLPF